MTIPEARKTFKEAFEKDADFRETYKANIAMAFYHEMERYGLVEHIKDTHFILNKMLIYDGKQPVDENVVHQVANKAADNFLNSWLND
jgi:hypothetical protein